MNARQNAKLNMYNAVIRVLNEHSSKAAAIPALVAATSDLSSRTVGISNTAEAQQIQTKGLTPDKNQARENLREITVNVASLIYAYAATRRATELQSLCAISISDLKKLKDEELGKRSQTIYDAALLNLNSLESYGVTNKLLGIMKDSIDLYSDQSPRPRAAIGHKKATTFQLNQQITEVDDLLRKVIDKIMVHFKSRDIRFYNAYFNARIIVDAAATSTQIKGTVTEQQDNTPIPYTTIEVKDFPVKTITDEIGVYSLRLLRPGTYIIKAFKDGYEESIITDVKVKLGKTTTANLTIRKL